jgi:hypothetical protein
MTQDEVENRIMEGPLFKLGSTQGIKEYLDLLQEAVAPVNVIEGESPGYGLVGFDNKIIFPERVTQWISKVKGFARKFKDYKATADDEVVRNGGVMVHTVMQHLLGEKIGKRQKISESELKEALKYMSKKDLAVLKKTADNIYNQIMEQQKKIDPKGEVDIRLEQVIGDYKKGRAGSIDVLAVLSDGKAMIYDYKTSIPSVGRNFVIDKELIYPAKQEQYKLQLSEYKRILESYGLEVVSGRVVPIAVSYEYDSSKPSGERFTGKINKIQAGSDTSEFLRQIALLKESTGYDDLDILVENKRNLIKILRNRAGSLMKKGEYDKAEKLYERATIIRNNIQDILIDKDIVNIGLEAMMVSKEIIGLDEDGELENISFEELDSYNSQLNVYGDIMKATDGFLNDLTDKKESKKIKQIRRSIASYVSEAQAKIKIQREVKAIDKIEDRFKTESGMKLKPIKEMGPIESLITRLSDIKHPIFMRFRDLVDKSRLRTRKSLEQLFDDIEEKFEAVRDTGMTRQEINESIVNPETQNLYSKLSSEWFQEVSKARKNKDSAKMKELFDIKGGKKAFREEYNRRLKQMQKYYKSQFNNLEDLKTEDGEIVKSEALYRKKYNKAIANWKKRNNLLVNNEAWFSENSKFYLQPKEGVQENYYSEEYKKISSNEALKEFYDFYLQKNEEFREMMGLRRNEMPDNFIANIRQSSIEKLVNNSKTGFSISSSIGEMFDSLNIREEDYYFAERDTATGDIKRKIPIPFLNPFLDAEGNIKQGEKSFDLTKSMFIMGKVAHNFQNMSEIEGETNALLDVLSEEARKQETTSEGKVIKSNLSKLGVSSVEYDTLRSHIDYHLYGVSERIRGTTTTILGKRINSIKAVKAAKSYLAKKALAFAVNPAIAQYFHGKAGVLIESHKGTIFTSEQAYEAQKDQFKNIKMYQALGDFFDVHAESKITRMEYRISKEKTKIFDSRNQFAGYRWGSEAIDNTILGATLRNYGIDENGNIKRLKFIKVKEGQEKKSLMDLFDRQKYLEEGVVEFAEMSDDNITQFKRIVQKAAIKVKGDVSEEDKAKYQYNAYLNALMQFKNWMPGILKERFGGIGYDSDLDVIDYGRYIGVIDEFSYEQGAKMTSYIGKVLIPNMTRLSVDLMTFGLTKNYAYLDSDGNIAVSGGRLERAKAQFQRYLEKNPQDVGVADEEQLFKMFLEAKQGAIRSSLTEVRAALTLLSLILFLGMEGDDDDKKEPVTFMEKLQAWGGRQAYKTLNRTALEISFSLSPAEFANIIRNPIPLAGLITDGARVLGNTVDESMDYITGREDKRDRTPPFYYLSRWVIGVNQFRSVVDWWYEQDKDRDR